MDAPPADSTERSGEAVKPIIAVGWISVTKRGGVHPDHRSSNQPVGSKNFPRVWPRVENVPTGYPLKVRLTIEEVKP